jgi:hypothetical protein
LSLVVGEKMMLSVIKPVDVSWAQRVPENDGPMGEPADQPGKE